MRKQTKITSVHRKCRNIIFFLNVTRLPLDRIDVIIIGQCRHPHTNEHLTELHKRDDHWVEPLRTHFDTHEEVVSVHHRMNRVIHCREDAAPRTPV